MATTIKTKNSVTTTVVPSSLAQGELAVNIADKKVWVGNASSTPVLISDYSGSIIGGSNTQIQYNNNGVFAGNAGFTIDSNAKVLVGTTSVSLAFPFTVAASASGSGRIEIRDTGNNAAGAGLFLQSINGSSVVGNATVKVDNTGIFSIYNGASTANQNFIIDTAGNIGVGTSPSALSVNVRSIKVSAGSSSSGGGYYLADNGTVIAQLGVDTLTSYLGTRTNHPIAITINNSEVMRIDTSGNVGIGETSPSSYGKLTITGSSASDGINAWVRNTSDVSADNVKYAGIQFSVGGDNGSTAIRSYRTNSASDYSSALAFFTKGNGAGPTTPTERMRITSGGTLCIGRTTGSGLLAVNGDIYIYNGTAGAGNSTLKYNTGSGQVTYDTSARVFKENIKDLEYGLNTVLAMQPRKYVYKATGITDIGFIADEMLSLVPEITPLANNTINDMGVPDGEPFTVNYDRLTAVLVKAIQELKAELDATKAEVATAQAEILALKAK